MLPGSMFHGKPLYVAIAQRKEDRWAQLQVRHSKRMNSFPGFPNAVERPGFHPLFYRAPGDVPQLPPRPGLMFHPLGMGPAWNTGGFSAPTQHPFQQMPFPMVHFSLSFFLKKIWQFVLSQLTV